LNADLVLWNGSVWTMDAAQPWASAVAVRCGRIMAVGGREMLTEWCGPQTTLWDLQGQCLIPGFCDAHIHLVEYGLGLERIQLDGLDSIDACVERVAQKIGQTSSDQWIRGRGWNRNLWPGARFPNRYDLDGVSPHNPIFMPSKDGHTAWVNSLGLTLAGLEKDTADPAGGALEHDPVTGELTGILKEGPALELVERVISKPSLGDRVKAVRAAVRNLHQYGIVSVHAPEDEEAFEALQEADARGYLGLRVHMMLPDRAMPALTSIRLRGGFGHSFLRLGPIKIYADGALGSRTADMFQAYSSEPSNRGIEVTTSLRLKELIEDCARSRFSVAVHAIGDRANSRVLDALEDTQALWREGNLRPRIEHVQLLAPGDAQRLGRLGVIASMQPIHCPSDAKMAERYWGERCSRAYAWRTLRQAGAPLAFGSDAPVEAPDVVLGLQAAVARRPCGSASTDSWYPGECLTAREAIQAYTWGGAYAVGEESIRGSITVGKLADLTLVSANPDTTDAEWLAEMQIMATVVDGKVVFRRDA
jgi:predicted amidohydrolase YtcJ